MDQKLQRKLTSLILKASTKLSIDYKRGGANYVRVPNYIIESFPDRTILGITIYDDMDLIDTVIVGIAVNDFEVHETIKINE